MYTVKHAARLTGIPADTLRMWERRYGVVVPGRTEDGYRVYDDDAITRLIAMRALVAAGWAPRRAAVQVMSGTTPGPMGPAGEASGEPIPPAPPDSGEVNLLVRLAVAFDSRTLSQSLDAVFTRGDLEALIDSWLMPALHQLGLAWQRGEVSIAAEHFVSAGVQRRLSSALDAASPRPGAQRVLVGLARGSRHELGVLAFAVVLRRAGFDVMYVGPDIPPESWVVAVTTRQPAAVVLGVPIADDVPAIRDIVAAITAVQPNLPVLLGGSHQHHVGSGDPLGHSIGRAALALADRLEHV